MAKILSWKSQTCKCCWACEIVTIKWNQTRLSPNKTAIARWLTLKIEIQAAQLLKKITSNKLPGQRGIKLAINHLQKALIRHATSWSAKKRQSANLTTLEVTLIQTSLDAALRMVKISRIWSLSVSRCKTGNTSPFSRLKSAETRSTT